MANLEVNCGLESSVISNHISLISLPFTPKYGSLAVPLNETTEPFGELGSCCEFCAGVFTIIEGACKFSLYFFTVIGEYSSPSKERTLNVTSPSPSAWLDMSYSNAHVLNG